MLERFFYVRRAVGQHGREFNVYKFRTMVLGAEAMWEDAVGSLPRDDTGKLVDDPRITPVGRFLRKYWIDELPQLFNLVRGDLKLVGLRPGRQEEWESLLGDEWTIILGYKPALIGVQYAFDRHDGLDGMVEQAREYLKQYDANPRLTDACYLLKFVRNVALKGMRSR